MVWHLSLPLMNSFIKTEAAIFSCRPCFLRAFPLISFIITYKYLVNLIANKNKIRDRVKISTTDWFISDPRY